MISVKQQGILVWTRLKASHLHLLLTRKSSNVTITCVIRHVVEMCHVPTWHSNYVYVYRWYPWHLLLILNSSIRRMKGAESFLRPYYITSYRIFLSFSKEKGDCEEVKARGMKWRRWLWDDKFPHIFRTVDFVCCLLCDSPRPFVSLASYHVAPVSPLLSSLLCEVDLSFNLTWTIHWFPLGTYSCLFVDTNSLYLKHRKHETYICCIYTLDEIKVQWSCSTHRNIQDVCGTKLIFAI